MCSSHSHLEPEPDCHTSPVDVFQTGVELFARTSRNVVTHPHATHARTNELSQGDALTLISTGPSPPTPHPTPPPALRNRRCPHARGTGSGRRASPCRRRWTGSATEASQRGSWASSTPWPRGTSGRWPSSTARVLGGWWPSWTPTRCGGRRALRKSAPAIFVSIFTCIIVCVFVCVSSCIFSFPPISDEISSL